LRIIGLDPGLRHTGWGIIDSEGHNLKHIAHGVISPHTDLDIPQRLVCLEEAISDIIRKFKPVEAAVEIIFQNKNPKSTISLSMARGIVLYTPAKYGLIVREYAANLVKKSVVGAGHANKDQVMGVINMLLPGASVEKEDAADALAISICHAHHRSTEEIIKKAS
jgi:crossover junction endodeoxyribonuclease RuvC